MTPMNTLNSLVNLIWLYLLIKTHYKYNILIGIKNINENFNKVSIIVIFLFSRFIFFH